MKNVHEYILKKCDASMKILDYGCGQGNMVAEGIKRGLDIYGVEAFTSGSGANIKEDLSQKGLLGHRVKEIDVRHLKIPFPDNAFDFIVSNQVFEHIVDLDSVLDEISRVLKNTGTLLLLFPSQEIFKEGHCGILFAHWFPKSTFRYYWLLFFRVLGFGNYKKKMTRTEWARFFNHYLHDSVTYRKMEDIHHRIKKYLPVIEHMEEDYIAFHLENKNQPKLASLSRRFPIRMTLRQLLQKWEGQIFTAKRATADSAALS